MSINVDAPDSRVVCPECQGRKQSFAHVCGGPTPGFQTVKCMLCDGLGWVSLKRVEWHAAGEAMREDRVKRGVTLRGEAKRLGISPSELSDREWGRVGL